MLQYVQCVAVYCIVLQRVAACCSVLRHVAARCSVWCVYSSMTTLHMLGLKFPPFYFDVKGLGIHSSVLQCVALCCSVLQFVTVRCSELCCSVMCMFRHPFQHGAACCSMLQHVAVCCSGLPMCCIVSQCVAVCYSASQCVVLQCDACL